MPWYRIHYRHGYTYKYRNDEYEYRYYKSVKDDFDNSGMIECITELDSLPNNVHQEKVQHFAHMKIQAETMLVYLNRTSVDEEDSKKFICPQMIRED